MTGEKCKAPATELLSDVFARLGSPPVSLPIILSSPVGEFLWMSPLPGKDAVSSKSQCMGVRLYAIKHGLGTT